MNDGAYPKTIVDSAERMITIPAPISRIIVLNSDAAEAVVTLGAGGEIVGITDEVLERSSHLPGLMGKQVIGTSQMGGEIDYELIGEIASAKGADPSDLLVIGFSEVGTGYGAAEAEKKLTPFGIRNVGLEDHVQRRISGMGERSQPGCSAAARDCRRYYGAAWHNGDLGGKDRECLHR